MGNQILLVIIIEANIDMLPKRFVSTIWTFYFISCLPFGNVYFLRRKIAIMTINNHLIAL
jgi:hypothetical protein